MIALPPPFCNIPIHRLSYPHPAPVHALSNLSQRVNHERAPSELQLQLWAKREDQAGPLTCYGNKYRKFEYIIPDILARKEKATILVTEGAVQSNHTVQVASLARTLGLKCRVLLHRGIGRLKAANVKESFVSVGNVQLNRLLGADVQLTDESDTGDEKGPLIPVLDELREQGETPYWISSGASLHPLGGLGYARCAFEIASQEGELCNTGNVANGAMFDYIFVACGSGSTLAGLIAGFRLHAKENGSNALYARRQVIGIMTSPTKSKSYQEERILRLARNTGALIGLNPEIDLTEADVHLDDGFVGDGYGILDDASAEIIDLAARTDSLLLDPVYTAKVMRGMLHWAHGAKHLQKSQPVGSGARTVHALFIHTGGQSALGAYADVWPKRGSSEQAHEAGISGSCQNG